MPEALDGRATNALALSAALSVQIGAPLPWPILRRAIDDALGARWLERTPDSGPWPCEAVGAAAVTLKEPDAAPTASAGREDGIAWIPKGARTGSANLEPNELQDLVDALPDVITAAAVSRCGFTSTSRWRRRRRAARSVTALNELLENIKSELRLKE